MVFATERIKEQARNSRSKSAALSRFAFEPADVAARLRDHIRGQDDVINKIEDQLNVISAGLYDERRPLLSALFIGATGTGKTETVRQLAKAIHGRSDAFCRIDMNTLSQAHYSAAITGAPPGYVGSKENLSLFDEDAIFGTSTKPGIVLFDEIEKADRSVIRALMNVLDNGTLRLASGQKSLSFHNTLVFMTSNVGSRTAERLHWLDAIPGMSRSSIYKRALLRHFDTEFINRIGIVDYFSALSVHAMPVLLDQRVDDLNQRLKRHQTRVILDDYARHFLINKTDFKRFGARALERTFRDLVVTGIAGFINHGHKHTPASTVSVSVADGRLTFNAIPDSHSEITSTSLKATQGENHD